MITFTHYISVSLQFPFNSKYRMVRIRKQVEDEEFSIEEQRKAADHLQKNHLMHVCSAIGGWEGDAYVHGDEALGISKISLRLSS